MSNLKFLMPLVIVLCSSPALAAIDCSSLNANAVGFVSYKQKGAADATLVNLLQKPTKLDVCGVKINGGNGTYSFQARDGASLSQLFAGNGLRWPVQMASMDSIGGEPSLVEAATLSITLPPESTKGIRLGGSFSGDLSTFSEIVVKADGGKLQTLLKDMRFSSLYFNPKTTKKIELYVKSPNKLTWTRMTFDVPSNKLTFYKSSAYPGK